METERAEVLVIGGGVVGLSCALALLEAGREVRIVERAKLGAGASSGNCGLITPSHAMPLTQPGMLWQALKWMLRKNAPIYIKPRPSLDLLLFGWRFSRACGPERLPAIAAARAQMLLHSRELYPQWIETYGLECEWQAGGQLLAMATEACAAHEFSMHPELAELGIEVQALSASEAAEMEPTLRPDLAGAAHYPGDAHLRPERLVSELARVVLKLGGRIDQGVAVRGFKRAGNKLAGVITHFGQLEAEHVVLATGAWSPELGRALGLTLPVQAGRGYSITMPPGAPQPGIALVLEEAAMGVTPWASGLRLGGSMEFSGLKSEPNPSRFQALRDGARRFLTLDPGSSAAQEWTGYRAMTPDELPIIGSAGRFSNLYLATGHGRMGISMAPSTALLIKEEICGQRPHIDPGPYSPRRFARNA